METKINPDNLTDDQQERMCELCELHILECSSNSSTFQCEGSRCEDAIQYLIEDSESEVVDTKLRYVMKLK